MTIRTGKSGRYRYNACSIMARQGETGSVGGAIPMETPDTLVESHIERRLLQLERLQEILASMLTHRRERLERCREHIAELNKRATEADQRRRRLYDAIESGVADITDLSLKERMDGPKAIRDQAQADVARAQTSLATSDEDAVTPAMVTRFADTTRNRMRMEGGGYRRGHLRALAQSLFGKSVLLGLNEAADAAFGGSVCG